MCHTGIKGTKRFIIYWTNRCALVSLLLSQKWFIFYIQKLLLLSPIDTDLSSVLIEERSFMKLFILGEGRY